MEKVFTVAQIIAPIFVSILLGLYARKKAMLKPEENRGLQQFVIRFALPCVLFNSCLTAQIGAESLTAMGLVLPLIILSALWAFRARKKQFPYHNLPQLFVAQETGMLGIPLCMVLFGADQAFRVGMFDLTQNIAVIPVMAILTADVGENPTLKVILKKVVTSPLLIASVLGLGLNFSGAADWLNAVGIGGIITETTTFLASPVSAVMLFSVGYDFSMDRESRGTIFKLSAIHFCLFAAFCLIIQAALLLVPNVEPETRWAILLYCSLPGSYLAPGMGRREEDSKVASGVCSLLTVSCLIVFCFIAAMVA